MRLKGYVLIWGDTAEVDVGLETFSPYSFVQPAIGYLSAAHLPGHRYSSTATGQLRLLQDDVGLRLEVDAGSDRQWSRLMSAIQCGMRGCSFTFKTLAEDRVGNVVTVARAKLSEVCFTGSPAYPCGGVWFDGEDGLPAHLAQLRDHWHAHATVNRPRRVADELTAFGRAQRWSASLIEPLPQARLRAGAGQVRELAGCAR